MAPSVSLCLIVRNEAEILRTCLASAADLDSEIILADTGSHDDTAAVARSFDELNGIAFRGRLANPAGDRGKPISKPICQLRQNSDSRGA